jgi:hypothetical protein
MGARHSRIARPLRGAVVTALVAGTMAVLGTGTAHANTSGIFIACADANSKAAVSVGDGCTTLADAVTSAVAYGFRDTIELMPGDYCPVTIPTDFNDLTIVGVGAAGLATADAGFTGPEAALSSFDLDATTCGPDPSNFAVNAPGNAPQEAGSVTLENIGLDGTAADGPANGINAFDIGLSLRDVLVQNFRGNAVTFSADNTFISQQLARMDVSNSAFLDNLVGFGFHGGSSYPGASIEDSTIAGNVTGIESDSSLILTADTITHNNDGVDNDTSNPRGQTLNTIVDDNTNDCGGGGGAALEPVDEFSGDNLLGATCAGGSPSSGFPDVNQSIMMSAVALVAGAPTPSIVPPTAALNGADGSCGGLDNTDQIEDPSPAGVTCDIGSIQSQPTTTTPDVAADPTSIDDGAVPVNQQAATTVYLTNDGGKLAGVSDVSFTGSPAFSLTDDSCTYQLLTHAQSDYCTLSVTAAPSNIGTPDTGDLIITTSANTIDVPLSVTGAAALAAPTDLTGVPGNGDVALAFTPLASPSVAISGYDVQQSTDGGNTWSFANTQVDSNNIPTSVTNLSNGTPYEFEIAATDSFGDGPWSAPTLALTPHTGLDASTLTAASAKTIQAGQSVTLSTTLTDSSTSTVISGATVMLTPRGKGSAVSATTNPQGVATAIVHPTVNTQYVWRYASATTHHAAVSSSVVVTVKQVVHAALTHKKVRHNRTVEIYGTVSPNANNKVVHVQRLVHGKWTNLPHDAVISLRRLPNHRKVVGFVYLYSPAKKGTETLRVSRAGTSTNAAGVSRRLTLKVT